MEFDDNFTWTEGNTTLEDENTTLEEEEGGSFISPPS